MSSDARPEKSYPAREVVLDDSETLIRGIKFEEWSEDAGRPAPSIFQRKDTSVTRIDQIGLEQGIQRVKVDVEKPGIPATEIVAAGKISVKTIKAIGREKIPQKQAPELHYFQVWEEVTSTNDMHAEIAVYKDESCKEPKGSVSLSYSRRLAKAVHLYITDPTGNVVSEVSPEYPEPTAD